MAISAVPSPISPSKNSVTLSTFPDTLTDRSAGWRRTTRKNAAFAKRGRGTRHETTRGAGGDGKDGAVTALFEGERGAEGGRGGGAEAEAGG